MADDKDAAMRVAANAQYPDVPGMAVHASVRDNINARRQAFIEGAQWATRRASARISRADIERAAGACMATPTFNLFMATLDGLLAAAAPEQKPATVRVRITSAGRTYELNVEPRPGMSELTGLLLNAMGQLKRQGMPLGHVTEIRYAKEEPCKN